MRSPDRRLSPTRLIAIGRTSEVYRWSDDVVAKVLNPGIPDEWADLEASSTEAVRRIGVAVPEVHQVTAVEGRPTIVFSFVDGPSLWRTLCDRPNDVEQLVGVLVEAQRTIHAAGVPDSLPSLVSRLRLKLDAAAELTDTDRRAALDLLDTFPSGAALLHGDLHPGNILLGRDGPVVIDWFDATVGHPLADVARTALLLQPKGATDLHHLPHGPHGLVEQVERSYLEQLCMDRATTDVVDSWKRLRAAGRLSELADTDLTGLLEIWRRG